MIFKDLKDLNLKEQYLQNISTEQNVIYSRNQFLGKKVANWVDELPKLPQNKIYKIHFSTKMTILKASKKFNGNEVSDKTKTNLKNEKHKLEKVIQKEHLIDVILFSKEIVVSGAMNLSHY